MTAVGESSAMTDLRAVQKQVADNKRAKGFNVTDLPLDLCLLQAEIAEFFDAWRGRGGDPADELADVAIYVLGIAEMIGIDLGAAIDAKLAVNAARRYERRDGACLTKVGDIR